MDVGSQNELVSDLIFAVFQEVLLPFNEPLPRNQADLTKRLDKRAELADFAEKLLSEFKQWLQLRHSILKAMNGAISLEKAMAFSDIKMHLERLMARGFLQQTPWLRLQAFTRYLKAMAYRLDKLQGNLARDRQSMLEFESIWLPYRNKLKNKELYEQGDWLELGWLLEEWRVALFAQPLGTSEPVSLKRLEKRWQELKDL
jgi:ATP-dependent helicase HrpA